MKEVTPEHTDQLMYIGRKNATTYVFVEITSEGTLGKEWRFGSKMFSKGSVGAIYNCTLKEGTISYNKKITPTTLLKKDDGSFEDAFIRFEKLYKWEEENRQVEIQIRNSKKGVTELDKEITQIRSLYKGLTAAQRSTFIATLIYKITK
tara:strand:- start:47651 stop:48097 length:447 start_codon:yes stop_codon:yes gene_type:complete